MAAKKTSTRSWVDSLYRTLVQTSELRPRLAIVGVGHELRGDDSAGLAVAHALQPYASEQFLVIEAGAAPENFTSTLRHFGPDFVLIVDAIQVNATPGTIRLFNISEIEVCSITTHTLSCHMLAVYLETELKCELKLLGIQAGQDLFGATPSRSVRRSVRTIVRVLYQVHQNRQMESARA